jgi:dipeptidyl-peptidase-4
MRNPILRPTLFLTGLILCVSLWSLPAGAQLSQRMQDALRNGVGTNAGGGGGRRGARAERQWVDGGKGYLTTEFAINNTNRLIVRHDPATGGAPTWLSVQDLTPPQLGQPLDFSEYTVSPDGKHVLFACHGRPTMIRKTAYDYWVLDLPDNVWHELGGKANANPNTNAELLYAKLSPDGMRAAYVRDNNLYVETIRSGAIRQLTRDGSANVINGTSDWVYEEEFGLADGFEWSPDGRSLAYFQFDQSDVPEFTLINNTDALYPVTMQYHYPLAGQTNAAVRVGIVSATGGRTVWLKTPGEPRNMYIPRMNWADADTVVLEQLNRLQNTNSVWLADAKTGNVRLMYQDRDDAWVDINEKFTWLEGGQRLLFVSERDGWRHAYSISRTGEARLITTGPFDLVSVSGVDEAGSWLYYIASPDNATQRYLYRSRLDGSGQPERVTPANLPGTHAYNISPDGHWAFHTWSRFDDPGVSDLVSLPDHKVARVLSDNAGLRARASAALAGRTEMFQVDAGDGATLDGWLIRPKDFDPARKYPLIVNVYGEPAATTVNDSWSGGRLLLAALAEDGYLIASFDNRGTPAPKGRAWRKSVYGSVGVESSREQAAAVRALATTHPYVDLDRVGVFGWSGGGSMTLNLMFRSPELFKVGVAGAPVADQRLYDSIYQERYMGLPQDNPDGYRAGSPINFAEGLQGRLLIIHGTGDDNVHFQGTQRLLNRLIELNKQFSFMEYPNRRHGITGVHLDTLRYGFFEQYLPAGGR